METTSENERKSNPLRHPIRYFKRILKDCMAIDGAEWGYSLIFGLIVFILTFLLSYSHFALEHIIPLNKIASWSHIVYLVIATLVDILDTLNNIIPFQIFILIFLLLTVLRLEAILEENFDKRGEKGTGCTKGFRSFTLMLVTIYVLLTFTSIQGWFFDKFNTEGNEGLFSGIVTVLLGGIPAFMLWHWKNMDRQRAFKNEENRLSMDLREQEQQLGREEEERRSKERFERRTLEEIVLNSQATPIVRKNAVLNLRSFYCPSYAREPETVHGLLVDMLNTFYISIFKDFKTTPPLDFVNSLEIPLHIQAAVDTISRRIQESSADENLSLKGAFLPYFKLKGSPPLKGINFENAKLWHAEFQNVNIENFTFAGADLCYATFQDCKFTRGNLKNTRLTHSTMQKNNFSDIPFISSDFSYATIENIFDNCDFSECNFLKIKLAPATNFAKCKFDNALFLGVDISKMEKPHIFPKALYFKPNDAFVELFEYERSNLFSSEEVFKTLKDLYLTLLCNDGTSLPPTNARWVTVFEKYRKFQMQELKTNERLKYVRRFQDSLPLLEEFVIANFEYSKTQDQSYGGREKILSSVNFTNKQKNRNDFLISHEVEGAWIKIRERLLANSQWGFTDEYQGKTLPQTAFIWYGTARDTKESVMNYLKERIFQSYGEEKSSIKFENIIIAALKQEEIVSRE